MRILAALFLLAVSTITAADTLTAFGHHWNVLNASDWKVEGAGGSTILHLVTHRGPLPGPRRPCQIAVADTQNFEKVVFEADLRPLQKSMIVVFCYRDPAHFNYAHLSTDTGVQQPVHNGVFHVFGGERVRISSQEGPPAFAKTGDWCHVRLVHDGKSGEVRVSVNGREVTALHAVDLSLKSGKIGVGSFDETGDFKNIKITGTPASDLQR
jgi:hypothetical protein